MPRFSAPSRGHIKLTPLCGGGENLHARKKRNRKSWTGKPLSRRTTTDCCSCPTLVWARTYAGCLPADSRPLRTTAKSCSVRSVCIVAIVLIVSFSFLQNRRCCYRVVDSLHEKKTKVHLLRAVWLYKPSTAGQRAAATCLVRHICALHQRNARGKRFELNTQPMYPSVFRANRLGVLFTFCGSHSLLGRGTSEIHTTARGPQHE